MRKGFKGFMNKVFKVVWSKSKECYVVVPEIAKNNSGKKKVLASVLAGLALVGAAGVTPVQAIVSTDGSISTENSRINIKTAKTVGDYGNQTVGVNSVAVGYGNYTNDEDGTIVYGAANRATANAAIALGNRNEASGGNAVALGTSNTATNVKTIAIGNKSNANAEGAIAIGAYNNQNYVAGSSNTTPKQAGGNSIVVGNYSHAGGRQSVAIGNNATTQHDDSVAIGADVSALAGHNIAIGSGGTTAQSAPGKTGSAAIAIGLNAQATYGNDLGAYDMIAVGNQATASANAATAIGTLSKATGNNSTAIGNKAHATASGSIAFGQVTEASAHGAVAMGNGTKSKGVGSTAIGRTANATNDGAVAVGFNAQATGDHAIAIGGDGKGTAFTDSPNTYDGLGNKTTASATNAISVGYTAKADKADGVALGSNSVTTTDKGVLGYNPSDLHTRKYTNLRGNVQTATTAAVSIGNGETLTRQLTGLAAGTADTDAVNVAQLKNVGVALTGNTGSSDFLTDGGKLNVRGEGRVSAAVADDGAKDSKLTLKFDDTGMVKAGKNVTVDEKTVNGRTTYTINAADAAAKYDFLTNAKANGGKLDGSATPTKVQSGQTVNYAAGKNLTVKQDIDQSAGEQTYTYSLNSDLGGITSITNKTGGPTLNFGDHNISITGGDLDLGDHNITHLHSGGDTVDNAANIGDVIRISKGNDLHVAPTAGTNNNVAEYTVDANKKVTLTYQDGNGKNVNGPKAVIDLSGLKTGDMSSFNVKSTATEGKVAPGSAGVQEIRDGKTVEMQAGKNMTIKQTNNNGNAAVEFSLNKNVDLTPDGSIKIGDTNITDNGLTINGGPSITKTGINAGDLNITNVKAGVNDNDAVNVSQLNKVRADERHIKPGEYVVDANGKVTMTYLDGNNKDVPNETAVITGIAKQDLSNINNGGKTVIKNLAKESIDMENGKNTTASHRDVNGVKTFKVDVEGDLQDITSITNKAGDGKVVFGGNQTVNVAGDHNIALNAKVGDITGLTNVTLDAPDFATRGRAATEEQLKIVNNGFNNTVGLTGNTGATDLQKLNQAGGLSFGVVGANNGQYIKTTAAGKNVAVDLSDAAKAKLNNTVEVRGKNAAKVTSVTENTNDGGVNTIYTVDVDNVTPTAASTEKVKAKADSSSSTDKNIAKVTPQAGDQYGDAGATYEVNVSRNDVKDAAREAITVNTTNTTNNPITVTPVQNDPNHNTTYTVTFDGNKAATQIPLTYKANGQNAQTVTLDKGLNFTNGRNTTASVDAEGVVKYDVNKDLVNINSISNTTNGPKMEFGPNSINITNGPINMGDQNITNLKSGGDVINNAANIGDVKTISKANDLHIAPTTSNRQGETTTSYAYDAASKSVTLKYNDGNGATQAGTVAKIDLSGLADQIKDGYSFSTDAKGNVVGNHAVTPVANGKTVSYAAGKNLTVAQNIDNATGEHTYTYALSNDVDLTPNGSLKIGDTILNNGGLTITGGPSITKTGINANNTNIINVKAGVNDTGAVNVKQLKDARTVVTSNDNSVKINKTENGNQVTYDLHVAPGAAQSVWNVKSTGNTTADSETTAKTISDGKTVEMAAGKNLTVKQTSNNDGAKVEFDLANNIKIGNDGKDGKDGVDGTIGVNGKDGSSVVINGKDGSIGLNGKDGKDGLTMKGEKGADGITRIVYNDNNNNKHEVATLDDGLRFDANSGGEKKNKLGSKVTVKGTGTKADSEYDSSNIKTSITQGVDGNSEINIGLAKDLNNINTIKNGGPATFTIGGNEFKFDGGNVNVGGNNITNVRAGVNDTDAVNVKQLKSAKTEVEQGDNVTVTSRTGADGQTIYKVSAKATNLGDAELNYRANGGAKQKVKLSEGLNFVDGNYTTASVDANGQVKYDVNLGNIKQGTDGKPGVNGKDHIATVKTVVDTINNSGWKANATGNVVGTSTATIVKPGSTVNYGAGKNLNVKQTVNGEEQTYEFALDKDLKELNSVQTNTIHLGSPTFHTTINYNAGNDRIEYTTKNGTKQVANLDDIWTIQANGQDVRPVGGKVNVVGGNHINVSTDAAGKMTISADGLGTMNGFNVKSTGNTTNDSDKTAKNITDGKTVEFSGGKNLTVKQTNTADGAKVEFALNNNIDLTPNGSVKIGDTVVNNDGLTIKNGPTITKNNVDMGGQQIHNVKSGGDVDSNGANIGDIKRISKANDTRIKDGNYEVSQNGTVEMTYVDGAGKQLVDEHGNPVKATISGIARQDLSNITNEGKKVITGLSSVVKGGNNVTVDTAVDKTTGQKTYTVNADLSGAKVNASVGADGSGVAKGLKNPVKVEKGTQYIAGDNMVVERKPVEGDDKIDNSITYGLAHDLTEINSISNGGATLRINANPGGNKYDRDANVTPALEVHGGNLSMTGNRIVNLAPGIDGTDGVNVNQLRDSLTTVKSTDGTVRVTDVSNDPNKHEYDLHVNPAVDPRVDQLNEEVGHVGAQSAALSALKPIQYDPMEPTQIMAGYGNYRGNSALALGVAHYKNESTMFHAGVSWAGGNGHMMANAGVTWKVGNRDSEAAVADRYRKGPISSTYAMQTEVASMKAQNAGLKGEVSDLKAENEQIKAQNAGLQSEVDQLKSQMAAMMAKLGM